VNPIVHYRGITERFRESHVAPTEACTWRHRVVQGNVHDENAYALEGIAGHAGLFGTARALVEIGRASIDAVGGDTRWFDPAWMARMVSPREGGSHRLGWDGKSAGGSSAGTRMSMATFGHLGFTGTSLWCDPEARVAIALVTNRVHPTRENTGIRALRVDVHDAVMGVVR
jgi:CubicO group peptidase (beta-lactamase class C family)